MSYNVELSQSFKKEAKRLTKRYPSLKKELSDLFETLEKTPVLGISLGSNVYKIRLSIASKNKGKSGGARVISFIKVTTTTVLLFSIYDKSEKNSISDQEVKSYLKEYL